MNWFKWKANEWKKRGEQACQEGLRGHTCYTEKQQVLWLAMLNQACNAFQNKMG
jgi:hypothetical protein